jgi:oligopeptide/dipeptide ABC transporter ATP-binding protein
MSTVLNMENVCTRFFTKKGVVHAVEDVSLRLEQGRIFGLVGESGAGKSITGFSAIRLIDPPGRIVSGRIMLNGQDVMALSRAELRAMRGSQAAMIFQDPQTSLNPVLTIGRQMYETLIYHNSGLSRAQLREKTLAKLGEVGLPAPEQRLGSYPHQLSGGMKQRIVIAMALLNNPSLLIADEPTTALDVTIQAQILHLMKKLCTEHGSAMLLITHDIGVVAQMCDQVAVMYAGRIVEAGTKSEVLFDPLHPYTKGLIQCLPKLDQDQGRLTQIQGVMPSLLSLPQGCHFRPRCPEAGPDCFVYPQERVIGQRRVSCHRIS